MTGSSLIGTPFSAEQLQAGLLCYVDGLKNLILHFLSVPAAQVVMALVQFFSLSRKLLLVFS